MADHYVFVVLWEESERGWGCRPDGYTLHINEQEAKKYIMKHDKSLPQTYVPDCYTRVATSYLAKVSKKIYDEVKKNKSMWGNSSSWSGAPKQPGTYS